MDAVATQKLPWVHVLDAYEISRLRPDAHPGPRRSIHNKDDCLHYCLPGIPDIFNGRLLRLMHEHLAARQRSTALSPPAAAASLAESAGAHSPERPLGAPGGMIDRWNFDYEVRAPARARVCREIL